MIKKSLFKSGHTPWNKGMKMLKTDARLEYEERQKGVIKKKPINFSEIMRKVNPPKGTKIKYDARDKTHEIRAWRKGYCFVYKPEHPTSRKSPPDYGYIAEHRYVIEAHTGIILKSTDVVHHIDGNKLNNSIDNLLVCSSQAEHNRVHSMMEVFVEDLIRQGKVYYDRKERKFLFR